MSAWPSRPAKVAAVALAGLTVAFIVAVLSIPTGTVYLWRDMALYNAIFVVSALLMALRADAGTDGRGPWSLLALGMISTVIGGILWSFDPYVDFPDLAIPIPDLFWLAFYPLAFVGILQLSKRSLPRLSRLNWLDALIVGSGAFAVGVTLVMTPLTASFKDADPTTLIVNSLYPMGDLILAALALSAAQAFNWRPPLAWWFLFTAAMIFCFADTLYLAQVAQQTYVEGSWIDIWWPVSALFFGLAAYHDHARTAPSREVGQGVMTVPSIMMFAAAIVLLFHPSGPLAWISVGAALMTIAFSIGRVNYAVRDARVLSEKLKQATIDPLTGLVNRRGLQNHPAGHAGKCSFIYLDLDGFGELNDTLGSAMGDRLLVLTTQRLRDSVRDEDLVTRIGGDEFGILLQDASDEEAAEVAEELISALEEPITLDGIPLHLSACAGVAEGSDPELDYTTLLQQADVALHEAKQDGPGIVRMFAGGSGERSEERLRIRAEIRASFRAGGSDFEAYYQPIISVTTGQVLAVEALVRWRREGDVLLPAQFLPDLVQSLSLPALTEHMLVTSLSELRASGLDFPVTVNVPPQMITSALPTQLQEAVRQSGSSNRQLLVEITEDAIMRNPIESAQVLASIRRDGFRVLLDDFGTGWSGLASLRDLAVDGLKLDASFVTRMATDTTAAAIVRAVAQVAGELNVFVVFEGVADPEALPALAPFPDGYVQGFALARPMPIADLVRWSTLRDLPTITSQGVAEAPIRRLTTRSGAGSAY